MGSQKPKPRFSSFFGNAKHRSAANVTSSDVSVVPTITDNVTSSTAPDSIVLSDGQCKQLIMFLQKSMTSSTDTESQAGNWYSSANISQFSVTILHLSNTVELDMLHSTDQWIVDKRATNHITPYPHLLHDVKYFQSILHLPYGAIAEVLVRNVTLSSDIILIKKL